ncbi:hypothetical protein MKW98_028446 [Papaver atlanticum]|uniref:Myb/SANT-like domain-containing protein n=1 Tax=Papaver atlanticum TaxID=357466 RepID=A0AAD4TGS9_9MAGN|nr:hypothetical protein MKW98_028446 [Papaver atlanticum]
MDNRAGSLKKRGGMHIFTSIDGLSKRFIDLCVEEIGKEGYFGASLKVASWKRIREALNNEFKESLPYDLDQKALKNHWDALKKKYAVWRTIAGLTGDKYNAATGKLDWPEWKWEEVIKSQPKAAQFRTSGLKYADKLYNLFEVVFASENESFVHMPTGVLCPHLEADKDNSADAGSQSNAGTSNNSGKRKRREPAAEDGVAKLDELIDLVKEHFLFYRQHKEEKKAERQQARKHHHESAETDTRKQLEGAEMDAYSLRECMVSINNMRRSESIKLRMKDYGIAMVKLAQSLDLRKAFIMLDTVEEKMLFICGLSA